MTETTWAPPSTSPPPPPTSSDAHDVAVQAHSDGYWYATCRTCGWASTGQTLERDATVAAGQHHQAIDSPSSPPKTGGKGGGWKIAFAVWNLLVLAGVVISLAAGGSAAADCATDTSVTYVEACEAGAGIGATILVGGLLFFAVVGNVTLGVAYAIFGRK